jgi:hypothetical protein
MWKRLQLKHKIAVSRDVVMHVLSQLDPEGCLQRRCKKLRRRTYSNKGPNFLWHADGYDKLKPYGFPIHGCIDGYSRRVLWLKVGTSNNNPSVVAFHFLSAVEELKGTPSILHCDLGTENSHLAFLQPFLRRNGPDSYAGEHSFRYGRSVSNQRIEAWWSQLKKSFTEWWIELFQEMQNCGLFDETNDIHRDCLRFCFMHLIQRELDAVVHEWNTHRIRIGKNQLVPAGIPNELFFLPQVQGTINYICAVNHRDLHVAKTYIEEPDPPAPLAFLQAANELMMRRTLHFPQTVREAMSVYAELVTVMDDY